MLAIAWALLGGWILNWFGFKAVVIAGMTQVFGVTINTLGYYFLFGMFGASRRVAGLVGARGQQLQAKSNTENLGELLSKLKK